MFDGLKKLVGKETSKEKLKREQKERESLALTRYKETHSEAMLAGKAAWKRQVIIWQSSFVLGKGIQPRGRQTLLGHRWGVNSLALLADGLLASASFKEIKLWDVERGEYVRTLSGHSDRFNSLTLLPDGHLASGSSHPENSIKLWDVERGVCVSTMEGHGNAVRSLTVLPDGCLASASGDKSIKLWDVKRGECVATLEGHDDSVNSLAVLADGRLASGSLDMSIKLWDVERGECVATLEGHSHHVYSLTLLADGRLASSSFDKSIKLWNIERGECVATLPSVHSDGAWSLTPLPDGRLASGGGSVDENIKLWDVERGECEATLEGHSSWVSSLTVLPDGRLASSSNDGSIMLWDVGLRPKVGLARVTLVNPHERGLVAACAQLDIEEHREREAKAIREREEQVRLQHQREEMERLAKEKAAQERKAREAREKVERERQEKIRQEKEAQERQRAEEARRINAAVDACKKLRSHWGVDTFEVLCDRYASMVEAMPEVSALYVERAAYFLFLADSAKTLDEKISWYEKALNDCDKALGLDQSNAQAAAEKARLGALLVPLRQEQEKRSALASLQQQWQSVDPKQLLKEYQTLIDQHPEDNDYYQAIAEYYVFLADKAGSQFAKKKMYQSALTSLEKAAALDELDHEIGERHDEISQRLNALNNGTPSPTTSHSASSDFAGKEQQKANRIDELGIRPDLCVDESELVYVGFLGRGGFGEVSFYRYRNNNDPVAVKKGLERYNHSDIGKGEIRRLKDEADVMAGLRHPNIVRLLGFMTFAGELKGLVLSYCSGGSLRHYLRDNRITPTVRLGFAIDLCEAIAYLHEQTPHIVHKDLNSKNVLVAEGPMIKVADFGLSAVREEKTKNTAHTLQAAGTARYMAPELLENKQANTASDIWALGMVLFELLTQTLPYDQFDDASAMQLMFHIAQKNVPHIPPDIAHENPEYVSSMTSCWAIEWRNRPSASGLSNELRALKSQNTTSCDNTKSYSMYTW